MAAFLSEMKTVRLRKVGGDTSISFGSTAGSSTGPGTRQGLGINLSGDTSAGGSGLLRSASGSGRHTGSFGHEAILRKLAASSSSRSLQIESTIDAQIGEKRKRTISQGSDFHDALRMCFIVVL